jgi:hypothetical protein
LFRQGRIERGFDEERADDDSDGHDDDDHDDDKTAPPKSSSKFVERVLPFLLLNVLLLVALFSGKLRTAPLTKRCLCHHMDYTFRLHGQSN